MGVHVLVHCRSVNIHLMHGRGTCYWVESYELALILWRVVGIYLNQVYH